MRTALLLTALLVSGVAAAREDASRPPLSSLERYGLEEGLSQLAVTALVEDDQGFLWIGTQEGLNRFDGHRFKVYRRGPAAEGGLVSSSIESLAFDRDSRLWIGTNDAGLEVMDLRGGERRRLGTEAGLSHRTVLRILLDPDGGAWIGTPVGIDRVDREARTAVSLGSTEAVVALRAIPGRGNLALDRSCRLWAVGAGALQSVPSALAGKAHCVDFQADRDGLWVATATDGLYLLDGEGAVVRQVPAVALRERLVEVTAMILRSDGWMLVGFADGRIVQMHPGEGVEPRFAGFDPRPDTAITLFHDHGSGVLWVGSATGGLFGARSMSAALRSELLSQHDVDAWPGRSVRSIWRDDERLLVGTDTGLAMRVRGGPWTAVESIGITSIRDIVVAPGGGWWVGTHRGLWFLEESGEARPVPGVPDPAITDLLLEGELLWVATRGGLARFRQGVSANDGLPAGLDGQFLTSLMRDDLGRLWIGSNERGVFRLAAGGALEHLDVRTGKLLHDSIWSLHADADAFWLGSFSAGLHRIDRTSGAIRSYSERDGLSNGVIYRIEPDAAGRLWLSTNNGLSVLDPATGMVQTLLQGDGLRNREFNSGASFRSGDGLLYFGGTEGIDIVDPDLLAEHSPPAIPVPSGLRVLGRRGDSEEVAGPRTIDTIYADHVELDYRDSVLSLDMVAIDFTAPDAARLRYRIDGLYSDWVQPHGSQAELVLSYLAPGTYPLEIQAAGRDGRFGTSRRLVIEMPPPPWRHPLAYLGYAMLALLLLAWMTWRVRARVRAERAQIELLNRTVAERTAELEQANRMLVQSNRQLDLANRTDPLTQVSNRRDLQDWLDRERAQVVREFGAAGAGQDPGGRRLYFCMIDVDDFKRINDSYGHQVGDEVLVELAGRLRTLCRERDVIVRWGGEEFMLLLRDARLEEVTTLVERIRMALADKPVELHSGARLSISCSIGFAPWPLSRNWPTLGEWDQSVSLADRALYAAKAAGKNAWVGVVPEAGIDRSALLTLLAGGTPEDLREGSVLVLHSDGLAPGFERG